jgi:hypothetical protein
MIVPILRKSTPIARPETASEPNNPKIAPDAPIDYTFAELRKIDAQEAASCEINKMVA